ncbi:MAG: hypothetical protein AAF391_04035 [Bacteroidota bacterium]
MNDLDFLRQAEVNAFIQANLLADVNSLILNPPKEFKERIKLIADQILSRQKAKNKLVDWVANPDLLFPPPLSIEQASSSVTSGYKASLIKGTQLVDLTGGTGIDCLALSDQFEHSTYVEQNRWLCELFSHNAQVVGKKIAVVNDSCENFLQNRPEKATYFLDPARRDHSKNKVFKLEDCSPNLVELLPFFQQYADRVLVKLSPLVDLTSVIKEVSGIAQLHVVSVKNDCKELLLSLDFATDHEPKVVAVNLDSFQPDFTFQLTEEAASTPSFGELKRYLYEPNTSIMKAGAFKLMCQRYSLTKLGTNTHLYTSDVLIADFPGKVFQVVAEADSRTIQEHATNGSINVITRNYPLTPEKLKKKFKIKDGGDHFLIGFRDWKEKPRLVICKKADL